MRLNAYLSNSGFCARRKAGEYIKEGHVKIGGRIVREPWYVVKEGDDIRVNGKPLRVENKIYIIINKSKGVTSTVEDKFAQKKITDLIPKKLGRLYPVGGLDKESRGLQILTNDGDFCYGSTHPKFEIEKEYNVIVNGPVDDAGVTKLKKGVYADGEFLKVKSCTIKRSEEEKAELSVIVCEGKKRHLRRLFKGIGLDVIDLKRVRIGSLVLGNLKEGSVVKMDKETIYRLALGRLAKSDDAKSGENAESRRSGAL